MKDRIGELMLLAKYFDRQPAFFPLVDQFKLLLFGSFDKGFSIRFVHVNRLNGKAIKQLICGKQAVACVFTEQKLLFKKSLRIFLMHNSNMPEPLTVVFIKL